MVRFNYDRGSRMGSGLRYTVIAALLILLAGVSCASASSAKSHNSVTWYLTGVDASGFNFPSGHGYDKIMSQSEPEDCDGSVTLGKGESVWWYSEQAARTDLVFPSGEWKIIYWVETNSVNKPRVYLRLYVLKPDGSAEQIAEVEDSIGKPKKYESKKYNGDNKIIEKEWELEVDDAVLLKTGDRLALEIQFSGNAEDGDYLKIYYHKPPEPEEQGDNGGMHAMSSRMGGMKGDRHGGDGDDKGGCRTKDHSRLVSPSNSPPYPVPELSSLALVAAGLTAAFAAARIRGA